MGVKFIPVFMALVLVSVWVSCTAKKNPTQSPTTEKPIEESYSSRPDQMAWAVGTDLSKFDLLAIDFVDAQNGWAVGDISPEGGPLFRTSDGGNSWQAIARITEVFASIQFVSPSLGWMAGYAGRIERTDDGGKTWKTQRFEREGEVLNALYFVDKERGWTAGGRGLICRTTNGGNSWEETPTHRVEDFWSVRFATPERGWIVGEDGLILSTTDSGNTWVQQKSGTTKALLGMTILPSGAIVAVGESGTILRSENGSAWQAIASGTTEMLNAVAAADQDRLWAVGSGGAALSSNDGGKSWTMNKPVTSRHLMAIDLISSKRGIAVGKRGAIQRLKEQ